MGILSGLLGAGASLIQSGLEAKYQRQNINLTNQANIAMSDREYANNLAMWNKANAYNTPQAQMQRFKDAGLNPNLIYGQGNPGNSPNVLPQYHSPSQNYEYQPSVNLPQMLSMFQDMRIKNAQVANTKAIARTNEAEATIKEAIASLYGKSLNGSPPMENIIYSTEKAKEGLANYELSYKRNSLQNRLQQIALQNQNLMSQMGLRTHQAAALDMSTHLNDIRARITTNELDYWMVNQVAKWLGQAVGVAGSLANTFK